MADGTPGIGRMAAVVGAMSALGSSRRVVCRRSRRRRRVPMYWPLRICSTIPPRRRHALAATNWEFLWSESVHGWRSPIRADNGSSLAHAVGAVRATSRSVDVGVLNKGGYAIRRCLLGYLNWSVRPIRAALPPRGAEAARP